MDDESFFLRDFEAKTKLGDDVLFNEAENILDDINYIEDEENDEHVITKCDTLDDVEPFNENESTRSELHIEALKLESDEPDVHEIKESTDSNNNNDTNNNINNDESDDHLPRVQEELDKLNYANESINNLELELEESKKEYLELSKTTEDMLTKLEAKLGSCVAKAKPYYDALIELSQAKDAYLKAKNRFETAQVLYVAAKEMQSYAEENLEAQCHGNRDKDAPDSLSTNRQSLLDLLKNAKEKSAEAEASKQKCDKEQIESLQVYEDKQKFVKEFEKSNAKLIKKAREYYELKASLNKELKFQLKKIEGLKSCVKEAKSVYQQSLDNLESISTEVHLKRKLTQSNSIVDESLAKGDECDDRTLNEYSAKYTSFSSIQSSTSSTQSSINNHGTSHTNTTSDECLEKSHSSKSLEKLAMDLSEEQLNHLAIDRHLNNYQKQIKLRPQFRASNVLIN